MSKSRDDYFTTGEAARLLSISRSSVSRRFDSGALWGKSNRVTGERLVHRSSLRAFMEEHDLPVSPALSAEKRVLAVSCAGDLREALEALPRSDARLGVSAADSGTDALLACSLESVDLLVLGDNIPDVAPADIIRSLRKRDVIPVKILCDARKASPEQREQWQADAILATDRDCRGDALEAIVRELLGLRDDATPDADGGCAHQRRWRRIPINLRASTGIYRTDAPRKRLPGRALVKNISEGGAYLSGLTIDGGHIPASPFRLLLEIEDAPLAHVKAHCKIVRLGANGSLSAGVQFVRVSQRDRNRIAALTTN